MERIALAVGSDKKLAGYYAIREVFIYEKQKEWSIVDRFPILPEPNMVTAAAVREKAEKVAKDILDRNCNNIVGKEIIGIPYHTLCRAGLEVFEADNISNQLLDEIYADFLMIKDKRPEEIEMVPPAPIPTDDEGNYFFDFTKAIKCHPELSSKKMLIPFLTNDLFFSLLIRCEHVMPWLDEFVKSHGLNMESKRENGVSHILLTHKSCKKQ
ncbi:Fe-only nitrogenase accessory AnfO family protein [Anaerocolumna sp. MB42-C2]|uniref:Fe-only nitrogenase accessory AnfO family protein n=1 Tax=Anaerocolumna sp. MB42-C2 TaxID=3070997 RepID=UPI0027E046F9|nr:Fe-only nitrogenase accessory AnfO family protein [Anaerocolumna sp. MB42-C2]WMJ88820.1 Fe-only nitrogenase accessory AnfO family protein [Anaerocolumna sp. MB42-C2]